MKFCKPRLLSQNNGLGFKDAAKKKAKQMEFSSEWKSVWTISSVFNPPSLIPISKSKSKSLLGPLLFKPSPKASTLLLSSPNLSPPFTIIQPHHQIPSFNNNLHTIPLSKTDFLFFFPYGGDQDRVGLLHVSKGKILGDVQVSEHALDGSIERIVVSSSSGMEVGFLLACTGYCVHWYRIECKKSGKAVKPGIVYLGSEEFKDNVVVHACWNPHYGDECLVLLDNGDILLFEVGDCCRGKEFPVRLEGSRVDVCWDDFLEECGVWLSCGFSWNPRVFIVVHSCGVFMIDWMGQEINVTVLAKVERFHLNRSVGESRFIAFVGAGWDGFYFAVATEDELFLMDVRKPMKPVLQWVHGLDNPSYIQMFKLSELRCSVREGDNNKGVSDFGFAILLGSLFNSEFSLFCYGSPLPAPHDSAASRILKFNNSLRAWELPTEISLLGDQCNSGDGLLERDFLSAALPHWKKERLLGFCIIQEDLSDEKAAPRGSSGFTLIRLLSSGKLESQKYVAVCDYVLEPRDSTEKSLKFENSFLDLFIPKKYKFPRRFRYLHLDSLRGFMNGDLPKVLMSKKTRTSLDLNKTTPYTRENYERICEIMRAAGVDSIGLCPTTENVLSSISWPMSIHEITSSRMWGGLNIDLMQLAFTIYSEITGVLVEHRKISLEALDIPKLPQLPPFFSKSPTSRSNRWSWNLQSGDVLVGPVLPLPYLLARPKIKNDKTCMSLQEEEDEDTKMSRQCHKVLVAAREMTSSGHTSQMNSSPAVSLANDREEGWASSKDLKPIFFHKPSSFSEKNRSIMDTPPQKFVHENEKHDTFISKTHEKENTLDPLKEVFGLEAFDDMCPVELNFDFLEMSFGTKERKGYRLLKRQFAQWQDQNTQYQDLCKSLKIQKTAR